LTGCFHEQKAERLKGWKAERKTDALPVALSAFQPSSTTSVFPIACAKPPSRTRRTFKEIADA
jgi:hypothetical protein